MDVKCYNWDTNAPQYRLTLAYYNGKKFDWGQYWGNYGW